MDVFSLFKPHLPFVKCLDCESEYKITRRELDFILKNHALDDVCPLIGLCECRGLYIPIAWTFKGKSYAYETLVDELRQLIENDEDRTEKLYQELEGLSLLADY